MRLTTTAHRDKAAALEHYARQSKNVEAETRACNIRFAPNVAAVNS